MPILCLKKWPSSFILLDFLFLKSGTFGLLNLSLNTTVKPFLQPLPNLNWPFPYHLSHCYICAWLSMKSVPSLHRFSHSMFVDWSCTTNPHCATGFFYAWNWMHIFNHVVVVDSLYFTTAFHTVLFRFNPIWDYDFWIYMLQTQKIVVNKPKGLKDE